MSLTFHIDASNLKDLAEKLFLDAPVQASKVAVREVAGFTELTMMGECPSSLKSGRGYRGPPLRMSITVEQVSPYLYSVGPTKRVDGKDLGVMLTRGSPGGQAVMPKYRKRMKFVWNDKIVYASRVRRGTIPPNNFVERTAMKVESQVAEYAKEIYESRFRGVSV